MRKLLEKYRSLSPTIKASVWFVLCNVIQKATQILTTPIYTRILSQTQYGEYTVFLSWVEVAAIFTTLDIFYSGYNVGMERFRDDRENYTAAMHGLCLAITTGWIVIIYPLSSRLSTIIGMPTSQIKMLILYMYVFPIFQFWSARKKYDYQYRPLIIVTAITSLATIVIGVICAVGFNNKSDGVILAKIIVEAVVAVPLIYFSINGLKNLYNRYYWKYALKFNIPLVPHYLSTMILNHSDRLMIVWLCNAAEAGIYSVAYSIAMLMTIIQNAINSAIVPWLYKKLRNNLLDEVAKITTTIIAIVAGLNLLLLIIAPEAIQILSTKEYYNAIYVIPPITFGVYLTAVYGLFVNVEFYYNYNKFAAGASAVAAISNVIMNFIFIRIFGFIAAGYTTFVSYFLLTVLHYWGLRKVTEINRIEYKKLFNIRHIVIITIGFAMGTILVFSIYNLPVLRYLVVCAAVVVILFKREKISHFVKLVLRNKEGVVDGKHEG